MAQCLDYQPIIARREFFSLEGITTNNECAVLSQLVYWASVSGFKEFYKTDEELSRETNIPFHTLRRIKEKLKNLLCLNIIVRGAPPKTYYKIDPYKILEEINSPYLSKILNQLDQNMQNAQIKICKMHKSKYAKCTNQNEQNAQIKMSKMHSSIYRTETTTKTTSEIDCLREEPVITKQLALPQPDTQTDLFKEMKESWHKHLIAGNSQIPELNNQDQSLRALKEDFEDDISKWDVYCQQLAKSSFLLGKKSDKKGTYWKLNPAWTLHKSNIQKVSSGLYDDFETQPQEENLPAKIAIPSFDEMILKNEGGVDLQVKQILAHVMSHQPEKYHAWIYSNNAYFAVKAGFITVEGVNAFCAKVIEREFLERYRDDLKAITGMSINGKVIMQRSEIVKEQEPDVEREPLTPEQRAKMAIGFQQLLQELDPDDGIKRPKTAFVSRELPMANLMSRVVKNIPSAVFITTTEEKRVGR